MKKFAVLGSSVERSLSPKIYQFIAKSCSEDIVYEALSLKTVEELGTIIRGGSFDGLNITMPYKKEALSFVTSMSEDVRAFQSANTLVREETSYAAYSTDGQGFVRSLEYNGIAPKGASVYLYGLGGASRPIAFSLIKAGVDKIYYESRTEESEEEFHLILSEALGFSSASLVPARALPSLNVDIAINASSLGTKPENRLSIDLDRVDSNVYYDIIYVRVTELLQQARARGRLAIGGLDMLIAQAIYAFELFYPKVSLDRSLFFELKSYLEA